MNSTNESFKYTGVYQEDRSNDSDKPANLPTTDGD
jgi:hypothetical protein